ncbi:MAG TPA: iron ABC transporter permease [Vicinamibacterales bacterium]|nr:iron ABC transporter permease [Vicinamibacterales bacterium]
MNIRRRIATVLVAFAVFAVVVIVWAPTVGTTTISLTRVFDRSIAWETNVDAQIFYVARLPRVLAGALVGATLAAAGVVLQALLRNPLATPFTLGVSAGASLGAILAVTMRLEAGILGMTSIPLASFAGSIVATAVVYMLAASQRRGLSTNVLLLAGVTLNSFFSALILFVQYIADFAEALRAIRWMMGGLDVASYTPIGAALPFIIVAFVAFATLTRTLNVLSVGTEAAAARGVDVVRAQRVAFLSASLATGAAVSLGGPIGFIGIIVPHLVRLLIGADHRVVLPASALFGASFLVLCDLVARTAMAPLEIPVGVVTAMIGGPFFLWLLVRNS